MIERANKREYPRAGIQAGEHKDKVQEREMLNPLERASPEASAADRTEPPVWDRGGALERMGGDAELLAELCHLFRGESDRLLEEVSDAVSRADAPALNRAAHALKGAAGSVGAASIYETAGHLETAGRTNEMEAAPYLLIRLRGGILRFQEELEQTSGQAWR